MTVLSYTNAFPGIAYPQHLTSQTTTVQSYIYPGAVQPKSTRPTVLSYTGALPGIAFPQHLTSQTTTVQDFLFPGIQPKLVTTVAYTLAAAVGAFVFAGGAATFTRPIRNLALGAASFAFAGGAAAFTRSVRSLALGAGAFAFAGGAATFTRPIRSFALGAGAFIFNAGGAGSIQFTYMPAGGTGSPPHNLPFIGTTGKLKSF